MSEIEAVSAGERMALETEAAPARKQMCQKRSRFA
jgi:hypothetical protein